MLFEDYARLINMTSRAAVVSFTVGSTHEAQTLLENGVQVEMLLLFPYLMQITKYHGLFLLKQYIDSLQKLHFDEPDMDRIRAKSIFSFFVSRCDIVSSSRLCKTF